MHPYSNSKLLNRNYLESLATVKRAYCNPNVQVNLVNPLCLAKSTVLLCVLHDGGARRLSELMRRKAICIRSRCQRLSDLTWLTR